MVDRTPDDQAPLAAHIYNTNMKIIENWNRIFENQLELQIITLNEKLQPQFAIKSIEQQEDEKALKEYFNDLEKYPKLKHQNSAQTGHYEILYKPEDIQRVRQKVYENRLKYYRTLNFSNAEIHRLAMRDSRIGKVWEDAYWTIYRDAVRNDKGVEFTYNRMVWNCDKDKVGGTAILPIIHTSEGKKL
ncbi:MAG: hypothetical protein HWD61_12725 [Parachlamydiaceae bacterium]|nr:MAG: hypothetical protein HWD61_12725 [Parachlamydiaceae bacterium]